MKRAPKHTSGLMRTIQRESRDDRPQTYKERNKQNNTIPETSVKKSSAKKSSGKVFIPVIIIAAILVLAVILITFLNKRNYPVNTAAYGISDEAKREAVSNPDVMNVVFLGIDHQEDRSDVMMVVSVNKKKKTVNVISLLRDTRVEIEGHAPTKLGYAYKWGGTDLTLKTINTNFNTAFDRYVCMTFEDLINIIDAMGGIDIQLTEDEAYNVNDLAQETGYMGWDAVPGWNTLNGHQAVAYSRIRKIDSEYARAGRQQVVIYAMIAKIKSMSVLKYPSLLNEVLGNLQTDLSYGELISLALTGLGGAKMTTYTIPDARYDENLFGGWVLNPDGGPEEDPVQWLWIYDLNAASYRLKSIMFDPDYWEDPDIPAKAWIWNELEDVIGGLDIDVSDIDVEDEIFYVEPETAAQYIPEDPDPETWETASDETTYEESSEPDSEPYEESSPEEEPASEEEPYYSEEPSSEEAPSGEDPSEDPVEIDNNN